MNLFEDYKNVSGKERNFFDERCAHIKKVLDILHYYFGDNDRELKNRSFIFLP